MGLKTLTHPALLVVDEIGFLPVTKSGAVLCFQLINRRYGHASTVLTSTKGFEEWGRILGDEVMAAALLDRLLHRCHIVNIRGSFPTLTFSVAIDSGPQGRERNGGEARPGTPEEWGRTPLLATYSQETPTAHGLPPLDPTARTADRAVLIELT